MSNDPDDVAGWFADALATDFPGAFDDVVFAVLDEPDGPNVTAFRRAWVP